MARTLITAPTEEPVTVAEAKAHLRVYFDDDDTLIGNQIAAARQDLEKRLLNSALVTQTWDYYLDAFPTTNTMKLPLPPLQSVTSITYTDQDGNSSTFSSGSYTVDAISKPGRIVLNAGESWPSDTLQVVNGVVVRFVAGYGAATAVPQAIKQGLMLLLGDMYEIREASVVGQGFSVITTDLVRNLTRDYRHKEF